MSKNKSCIIKTNPEITQQEESEKDEPTKALDKSQNNSSIIHKNSSPKIEPLSSPNNKHSSLGAQVPVNNASYDILDDLMGLTPKNKTTKTVRKLSSPKKKSPDSSVLSQLMGSTTSKQSINNKRKIEDESEEENAPPKKTCVPGISQTLSPKKVCINFFFYYSRLLF